MAKKDKKIEIQLADAKIKVLGKTLDGFVLTIGKREVGQIIEMDQQFATVKDEAVDTLYKSLDQAMESIIENYNLNH